MNLKQNSFFDLTAPLRDPLFSMIDRQYEQHMTPAADVVEEDEAWLLRVDLPGVEKDNINIEIHGDQLMVSGKRHVHNQEKHKGYAYLERVDGQFKRIFTLPETVNKDSVSATIKNGVIEVRVEKLPETQPRKILIEDQH